MLYLMTMSEQQLIIYDVSIHKLEKFLEALNTLSKEYLLIFLYHLLNWLICKTKSRQKQTQNTLFCFLIFQYYYNMKLVSFGYDKNFNLLLQFPGFIEPYTRKAFALYQLQIAPVPIIVNITEANSCSPGKAIWL